MNTGWGGAERTVSSSSGVEAGRDPCCSQTTGPQPTAVMTVMIHLKQSVVLTQFSGLEPFYYLTIKRHQW